MFVALTWQAVLGWSRSSLHGSNLWSSSLKPPTTAASWLPRESGTGSAEHHPGGLVTGVRTYILEADWLCVGGYEARLGPAAGRKPREIIYRLHLTLYTL